MIALLFMLLVYGVNRNAIKCRVRHDHYHDEESYGEILKLIILIVSPIILSSFIYNINGYLNGVLYSEIMGKHGVNADMISMMYEYNQYSFDAFKCSTYFDDSGGICTVCNGRY